MLLTFLHIIPSLFSAPDDLSVSDDMIPGTVKSITVSGVYGEGDYDFSTEKWIHLANPSSYDIKLNVSVNAGVITSLTDKTSALMMIPQDFGPKANAKVSMVFNDGAKDKTVSFSLNGTSWKAGNHITYVLSSSKITTLKMGDVTYPKGWNSVNDGATYKIRKAYDPNDPNSSVDAGLFVVNEKNKVIEANVQLTYDGTSWSLPAGSKLKFSPQYNYFVYYPYQEGRLPGAPAKGTEATEENVASADNFFAKAIDTWKSNNIAADQSTPEKMNACDLQIGKASLDEDGCSVSFAMEHAMGLAEITLGAKTFDANYKLFDYESYTWKNRTTFHAYAGISGYSFYKVADYRYVALVKPKVTTVFSCGDKNDPDAWTKDVPVMPAANDVAKVTAISNRDPKSYILYTMEVGDIYYSDGAMTHQSEELALEKTPIGIVGYLGNDYWTEKDVVNSENKPVGGHALVMCLKTIGSTGSTKAAQEDFKNGKKVYAYTGTGYKWHSSSSYSDDKDMQNVTRKYLIVGSKNQPYGSGYTDTNYLITKWGSNAAAATAAKNYNTLPANSSKCTGWFLPSAGQYYAVMSQLGGGMSPDWEMYQFFSNMATVTENINDKLMTVGDLNYTEFFRDINTWEWTSSEYTSTHAVRIGSGVKDGHGPGSVFFTNSYKYYQIPVRPFLAF